MLAVCVRTGFGHQSPAAALTGKTFLHSEVREGLVFLLPFSSWRKTGL